MLTWKQLRRRLERRGISEQEIDRVVQNLSTQDPAEIMRPVSRERVGLIAAYMNPARHGIVYHSPLWNCIVKGHPSARAIYYHEEAELRGYDRLGVRDSLRVDRTGETYYKAHALACYEEALYWEAWAGVEGASVSWQAFLHANPLRSRAETAQMIRYLTRYWNIKVALPYQVELERAAQFYEAKRFRRGELGL